MAGLADLIPLQELSFYARDVDEVHEAFAEVRRREPVFWHETGGFWVLMRHGDQRRVGSNPQVFSSRFGFQIADTFPVEQVMENLPDWAQDQLREPGLTPAQQRGIIARAKVSIGDPELESVIVTDPPKHLQHRKVMTNGLTPKIIRGLEPEIIDIVDDALDGAPAGSTVEFVEAVARRIPLMVIGALLGVPKEESAQFVEYADAFMATVILNERDPEKMARNRRLLQEFSDYILRLIAEKRANPGEDLLSGMLATELDGAPVPEKTVQMLVRSLISGGTDTTKHLLAWVAYTLGTRPEARALLRERPELAANAVTEITRWSPIVWSQARTALEDTEIGDKTIRAGDFVVMVFPSANRDEDAWDRPFEFDITREFKVQTMAFGWGEHLCPGNPLARLEAKILIDRLTARYADYEVVGEPERFCSSFINGLRTLDVRFS